MGKITGDRIRQARTAAKMTQGQLAKATALSAGDISKAERGELELSQSALRAIAKATGVTQTSLVNAEKPATKEPKAQGGTMKLSGEEKRIIQLYRKATAEQKSDIKRILNGEKTEVEQLVDSMLTGKWRKKLEKLKK